MNIDAFASVSAPRRNSGLGRILKRAVGALAQFALALTTGAGFAQAQGIPHDWSHGQIVFSNPGAAPPASNRAAFARWSKIVSDPRFKIQSTEFAARKAYQQQNALIASLEAASGFRKIGPPARRQTMQRDWSMNMANGTVGAAANGAQRYPAKWSFDSGTTPFCDNAANPDFVVYATGNATAGVADIIAYDNLYKTTCTGSVPMVYFRYNVGGTVPSSPVFSLDGKQLAFINVNGSVASLILLKWAKNPALVALTAVSNAAYRGCTAPCFTSITLNGSPNSTGSSVFVDYEGDAIYVGDNNGTVHKFINVFLGTPSEITGGGTTSGWPLNIHTGAMPSGVFDSFNNNLIIGAGTQVARIPANGGSANVVKTAATRSACGFLSPPVVDIVVGRAYFTLSDYNGTGAVGTCASSATGGPAIIEYSTTFAAGASHLAVQQLPNGTARNVNVSSSFGNFDQSYYDSTPGNPSGKFYACLYAPNPKLVQFTITNNLLTSFINGPNIATATGGAPQPSCTPVVQFFDGVTDRIFTGVYTGPATTAGTYTCGGVAGTAVGSGCIIAYNVTQPFTFSATTAPQAQLPVPGGGASGIVIDNRSTLTGASQVYFQTIMPQTCIGNGTTGSGTGWCAIQASQNGLN